MAVTEKISTLVKNQFPDFYKEEGDNFLEFIQAYYEWMEENDNLTDSIRNLKSYRDISTTTDDYIQYFFNTLIPGIPTDIAADKRLFARYVKYGNISRGTLRSYNLLFRILFNESIDLYYPSDSILKVSDGDWRIDRYLVANFNEKTYNFIGKTIRGADSKAEALVEDVVTRTVRGRHIMQILLSNIRGTFQHLERIFLKTDENFTGHSTVVDAGINKIEVITPGGEYRKGDVVELRSSIIGRFAKVVVTGTEDQGGVLTFSIINGGSGYVATDNAFGASLVEIAGPTTGERASFQVYEDDIVDTFEISICTTLIAGNTVFGDSGAAVPQVVPSVTPIDGTVTATTSNNTIIGVGTDFISDLQVGDRLFHHPLRKSKVYLGTVGTISNNTVLTTDSPDANRNNISGERMYYERTLTLTMSTLANTPLCAPDFGFRAAGETATKRPYRDHEKAVLRIANTQTIFVGDSLYGVTSGANGTVISIVDTTPANTVVKIDGYRNFDTTGGGEAIRSIFATASGNNVGSVISFSGNTVGKHYIGIANTAGVTISVGDEIVGKSSNCYAVIKNVDPQPYSYIQDATSNTVLSGTVTAYSNSSTNTVVGSGTSFLTDFQVGDTIKIGSWVKGIISVNTNVELHTTSAFTSNVTTASAYGKSGEMRTLCRCHVSSNSTANLTSTFDTGPIIAKSFFSNPSLSYTDEKLGKVVLQDTGFLENEGLRFVGSTTTIANVEFNTGNTNYESIATPIGDCLVFESSQFGTIANLSDIDPGTGYYYPPKVSVTNPDMVALGIGEAYLTLHTSDSAFGMSNSQITDSSDIYTIDTNDRLVQTSTGASGDVKGSDVVNTPPSVTYYSANNTYEIKVRVWQDFLQRDPGGINWEHGPVTIKAYNSTHIVGTADTRSVIDGGEGTARIVDIVDGGVLGKNADIISNVGANGTIIKVKTLDSGFNYGHLEECLLEESGRPLGTSARVKLYLRGVANSAGYYYSDRSHISTARGYIQDSEYYQEFSYEIISAISLNRYRDIALEAVHPAGNRLFGKFRNVSNSILNIVATPAQNTSASDSIVKKHIKSSGTVSLLKTAITGTIDITANTSSSDANNLFTIQGFGTDFENELSANSFIIIETDPGNGARNKFMKVQLNDIVDANTANLNMEWTYGNVTGANVYYSNAHTISGTSTALTTDFANNDFIVIDTGSNNRYKFRLNKVNSATSANIVGALVGADISSANVYYIQG